MILASPIPSPCPRTSRLAGTAAANVAAVAGRELREALRSRWFLLYTLAFAALGLGVSYISAAASGASGLSGFGRTSAGLVNMVLLVVPLMALTAGAGTIASDRERGMLAYLLAQPVTRWEVLLGKYLGLAAALGACICLGLGACAGVLAWKGASSDPAGLLWLAGLSFALALAMLSVGMLISVLARKASVATGTAVFTWLALALVTDLGLMAGVLALRMRIENLFALSLINPLQVFKMWTLYAADASLDVLGPAGLYADDRYGPALPWVFAAALLAWVVGPLLAAGAVFAPEVHHVTYSHAFAHLAALALLTSAGCGRQFAEGPPEIRLGRDECAECGMIINEDRCSASMVIDDRGDRKPLLFDDIGDLLDYERHHPGLQILNRYVHDHTTRDWIDATTAQYVRSDDLHTPMGSGLAAFRSRADAEAIPARDPANVMKFQELVAFRRKWMEDRYGKPNAPAPTPGP